MSENPSYIETKNDEKNKTKDVNIGGFVFTIFIGIVIVILYFYIASINLIFSYKYSGSPGIAGQNLLLVPYTPYNTMAQYAMGKGKEAFKRMKLSGGFKIPSMDDLFPMDSWSFPYKNMFTEKQYERTHSENMEDVVFRVVSWFTESMAATFSTARFLLQIYFSGTKQVVTTLDEGTKQENKIGELLVFLLGTPMFILSFAVFSPIFAAASTIVYSLFNIRYALPPFLGFNFLTLFYFCWIIPVILNIIFIIGGMSLNASITSTILPLIYLGFILSPLGNKDMRKKITDMMFSKKKLATFAIMLVIIISASNNLGSEYGFYVAIAGIIFILAMMFNLL